ncbi:MAG: hypothetical protein ACEPOZ_12245 [Marinifilaceae bacterium]|jgi:hypothetical protein
MKKLVNNIKNWYSFWIEKYQNRFQPTEKNTIWTYLVLFTILNSIIPTLFGSAFSQLFGIYHSLTDTQITLDLTTFQLTNVILLPIACCICLIERRLLLGILLIPSLASYTILVFPELYFRTGLPWPFLLISGISYIYLAAKTRIRSLFIPLSSLYLFYAVTIPIAVLFLLIYLILRVTILLIEENREIFIKLCNFTSLKLSLKALLLWSPLLLLVVPGTYITKKIESNTVAIFYDNEILEETNSGEINLPLDTKNSLYIYFDQKADEMKEGLEEARNESYGRFSNVQEGALSLFDEYIPTPQELIPTYPNVKWYDILKKIENAIRKSLQSKYRDLRTDLKKKYIQKVNETTRKSNGNFNDFCSSMNAQIDTYNANLKYSTETLITSIVNYVNITSFVSMLLFALLILKSYMYVFSRIVLSNKNNITATLAKNGTKMEKGKIRSCGQKYTINAAEKQNYYVTRTLEPSGRPPKYAVPQWKTAILPRLKNKTYSMNFLNMVKEGPDVCFQASGSKHFVEWELAPNEEIIFNYKNFVAMSDSVKLTNIRSLKITSILFGKMFFKSAIGPGKIVLLTNGKPSVGDEVSPNTSIPADQMLAWQRNSNFYVEAENNVVDVFFSSFYLQKSKDDLIVIDADDKGKPKSGIIRFAKSFLLPV